MVAPVETLRLPTKPIASIENHRRDKPGHQISTSSESRTPYTITEVVSLVSRRKVARSWFFVQMDWLDSRFSTQAYSAIFFRRGTAKSRRRISEDRSRFGAHGCQQPAGVWRPNALVSDCSGESECLSFVSVASSAWYQLSPEEAILRCGLPRKYLIFPSQFWIHKNHKRLLDAIRIVKGRFPDIALVCTGRMYDYRQPHYAQQILTTIQNYGLEKNVYCLGLLDRLTQIHILRGAAGVIQPSLFEGWSALVEDARALGKPLYLSDIPVHREQDPPDAQYFDPLSSADMAVLLAKDWETLMPGPDRTREESALPLQRKRALDYARSFLRIVREASRAC